MTNLKIDTIELPKPGERDIIRINGRAYKVLSRPTVEDDEIYMTAIVEGSDRALEYKIIFQRGIAYVCTKEG